LGYSIIVATKNNCIMNDLLHKPFYIFDSVFWDYICRSSIAGLLLLFSVFLLYSKCLWMWFRVFCVYSVVVEYRLMLKGSWLQRTFKLDSQCDVFSWWIIVFDIFWWPDNQGEK
jgi:hypothetical protein